MDYTDPIIAWVGEGASVLDLGCGDGELLVNLERKRHIRGYGIENDPQVLVECLAKRLNVLQIDLDKGLANFNDKSFDLVVLKHTLQALRKPHLVVEEMLRVGRRGIVTFHNFSHWRNRWQLAMRGVMPVSRVIPYPWHSTPNIHHCTCRDFEALCRERNICIEESILCSTGGAKISPGNPMRHLFTNEALYLIRSEE